MIYLELYWSFFQIGFTSFGGLSMISLINQEMLAHQWMTILEVADIVAIAEMTPGPIGLNCATFAGMRVAGLGGALAANLGILTPTFTVCAVAAVFFERFRTSKALAYIMLGVRPVCIGVIWAVILGLCESSYWADGAPAWANIAIGCAAAYLLIRKKWKIPLVIGLSALLGLAAGALPLLAGAG